MEDSEDFDISPFLEKSFHTIHNHIKNKESVLVACTAGISRSASLCIAYLIRAHGYTYQEAFEKVKSARPFIKPNSGFVA